MKHGWPQIPGTGRWPTLLAFAAALALVAAVACGGEVDDSTDAEVSGGSTSTTETTTTTEAVTATTDVAPAPSIPIGHTVGMLAPDFTVETVSGESFSLSEATAAGSPVLLYFFATWWPTCNAEVRHLQSLYPDYQDNVVLIGVDVDPGESAGKISGWADRVGLTWPLAAASNGPLSDYRITQQSAAVGIDASGEIVLRKNGGLQNEAKWREWLDTLAGPTASAEPQAPSAAVSSSTTDSTVGAAAAAPTTAPAQPTAVTAPPDPTAIIAAPPAAPPPTAIPVPTTAPPPPTAVPAPPPTAVPAPPPPPTATPRPAPTATAVPTATPNIPVGHNVGQRAPDFTVTAVSGETITLSEVTASGKAVLIYFFATW